MNRFGLTVSLVACLATPLVGCGATQIDTSEEDPEDQELLVELRGNRIVFNHRIQFEHDSDALLPASDEVLGAIAALLVEHEELYRIQVQGHSSAVGEPAHNQELSTARAAAVAAYISEHGVTQEVTSQGYGQTYPLCGEDTEDCHARNRRVEFFVDSR